ncbi:hypothetical protein FKM82_014313 [Ascaphus truei]
MTVFIFSPKCITLLGSVFNIISAGMIFPSSTDEVKHGQLHSNRKTVTALSIFKAPIVRGHTGFSLICSTQNVATVTKGQLQHTVASTFSLWHRLST